MKTTSFVPFPVLVILIFFTLNLHLVCGQNTENDLVEELKKTDLATKDRSKFLLKYSYILMRRDLDSARIMLEKSLKLGLDHENSLLTANAYHGYGVFYRQQSLYDSALIFFEKAEELLRTLPEEKGHLAALWISKGNLLKVSNDLEGALADYQHALDFFRTDPNPTYQGVALKSIGDVYLKQKLYRNALEHYQEALQLTDTTRTRMVSTINSNLAAVYLDSGLLDSATFYLGKTLRLKEQLNDQLGLSLVYSNMAETYSQRGKIDSAIYFQLAALKIQTRLNMLEDQVRSKNNLSTLYQKTGNWRKGKEFVTSAIELASQIEYLDGLSKGYWIRSNLDSAMGNYADAYRHLSNYTTLREKALNEKRITSLNELEVKYESAVKDGQISTLEKQYTLEQLKAQRRSFTLLIVLAFALMLTLVGVLMYQQLKVRNQKKLQYAQQKLLRAQLSPHFLFNSLSAIQHFILVKANDKAVEYLGHFGQLMRQILEHSRVDYIPVEEELTMLENYLKIQQFGSQEAFSYQIEVDPEIDPELDLIPPLFAQPFVENAIQHGLNGVENGLVSIKLDKRGAEILLTISDNGSGFSSAQQTPSKKHKSLATLITKERLHILQKVAGKQIGFVISSLPGQGTTVNITLPVRS